jgi:hypothetical protein
MSPASAPNSEWQRIWFSLRQHTWTSVALVPSHAGIDVVKVAGMLVATARLQGERPVDLVDATGVQIANVQQVIESLSSIAARGASSIVPVDPILENPSAVAIVRASTVALLVVRLGESLIGTAQTSLDLVGRSRFIGSIVVDGAADAVST